MAENRDRLRDLDNVIGDGDLGLTMPKGFAGAAEAAREALADESDPGRIFAKAGMAINRHAPSTMGTLMATGFMRGGKAVSGRGKIDAAGFADFLHAFFAGVRERGKANPGEKTVLDAIKPAMEAATGMAGNSLPEALAAALKAAEAGLEAARPWMSQHGKSAVFREKTSG